MKTLNLKFFAVKAMAVIGHVTIGLVVGTFLLMVNDDYASILHG